MGFQVLECRNCIKKKTSPSRGKFYAETTRIHHIYTMALICATCKAQQFYKIVAPKTKDRLGTGQIYHCFNRVHKIYITNENVIINCTKCDKKQFFRRIK